MVTDDFICEYNYYVFKEEARQITKDNLIHQVDQKLRECVSLVLRNYQGLYYLQQIGYGSFA